MRRHGHGFGTDQLEATAPTSEQNFKAEWREAQGMRAVGCFRRPGHAGDCLRLARLFTRTRRKTTVHASHPRPVPGIDISGVGGGSREA